MATATLVVKTSITLVVVAFLPPLTGFLSANPLPIISWYLQRRLCKFFIKNNNNNNILNSYRRIIRIKNKIINNWQKDSTARKKGFYKNGFD